MSVALFNTFLYNVQSIIAGSTEFAATAYYVSRIAAGGLGGLL